MVGSLKAEHAVVARGDVSSNLILPPILAHSEVANTQVFDSCSGGSNPSAPTNRKFSAHTLSGQADHAVGLLGRCSADSGAG